VYLYGAFGPHINVTVSYTFSSLPSNKSLKMGAGQSIGSHPQPPARALHVLRVTPSSPASFTNIEAFFDFVVGLEGDTQSSSRKVLEAAELEAIVEKNEGKNLNLLVWNSKSQTTRGTVADVSFLRAARRPNAYFL
jgi:hypothetical protein